jgi:hypothetical protein
MSRVIPQNASQDKIKPNGLTSLRDATMRQSFVFANTVNPQQRSFISTSLVNDSYAFGDDLRKYPLPLT